ncbi:MAG TPA: putative baseplate assembly protein [Acidobacteriaceae bacterium]
MKQPCGCCTGIEVVTPQPEANRPGLPAIAYRMGTYATFLESMMARLSSWYLDVPVAEGSNTLQRIYPLRALTTRELSDPSIALLDAWAIVADVLTFYQERIANEGFLRTAVERRSVLELARLVGYRLRPGISASVYLAFTVSGGFDGVIPGGTRAQSLPAGTGDKPQPFETFEDLAAKDAWNALTPRLARPQVITLADYATGSPTDFGTDARTRDTVYLEGISTNLKRGDALLFVAGESAGQQALRFVEEMKVQAEDQRTEIVLVPPPTMTGAHSIGQLSSDLAEFIEQAQDIFADSDLATEVAAMLTQLNANLATAADSKAVAELLAPAVSDIEQKHDTAVRRKFTRLEPWLLQILQVLTGFMASPPGREAGGTGTPTPIAAPLEPFPLGNLFKILEPLAKPQSLQPRNSFQLSRTVQQAFASQSDIAPRLLAAFHPEIAPTLYKAWSGIVMPVRQAVVYAMRAKAAPFGNNAPLQTVITDGTLQAPTEWQLVTTDRNGFVLHLDAVYDKVTPGSWVVVNRTDSGSSNQPMYLRVTSVDPISRADYGMAAKTTRLSLSDSWLDGIPAEDEAGNPPLSIFRGATAYTQPELLDLADEPLDVDIEGDTVELDSLYSGLESGKWIIVSGERTDIPNVSGVTGTELVMISSVTQGSRDPSCAPFPANLVPFSQYLYTTNANAAGDRLVVGQLAVDTETLLAAFPQPPRFPDQTFCDQVQLSPGTYVNAYVPTQEELGGDFSAFDGLLIDPATHEAFPGGQIPASRLALNGVFAWRISSSPVHTILKLANKLAYTYEASTVTLYGNVVKATHGQTQGEVMGDGDASQTLQHFPLHQAPLTYLPAPTPAGAASTLTVRVNEVAWQESPNLFVLGPSDRAYITETDDAGTVTVITGNGEHGLRVPSGTANVKAVYRSGTGKVGNAEALQISQLATQPLGVKSVINPLRASGGADGDTRDQARRNVPIGVAALDRLVAIADYADFARAFAGIAKASAQRLSDGRRSLVHLTIAGKDDIPIDANSDLYQALRAALAAADDPYQPVHIAIRRLRLLVIAAGVKIKPAWQWETVAANLRSTLLDLYSFDRRELGQSAFLSEAVSAIQAVDGVLYVNMQKFSSVPESVTAGQLAGLAQSLGLGGAVQAELAHVDPTVSDPASRIVPAELVMLTPDITDTLILTEIP